MPPMTPLDRFLANMEYRPVDHTPNAGGVWCVAGAFGVALEVLRHDLLVSRDGQATYSILSGDLAVGAEPRIHILVGPRELELTEAVDELGNSLLPDPQTRAWGGFPGMPCIVLKYPANPGRRIVRLKGFAPVTIQGTAETLTFENLDERTEKTCAGMKVSVGPLGESGTWTVLPVVFARGEMPAAQFEALQGALGAIKPTVVNAKGGNISTPSDPSRQERDQVVCGFRFWNTPGVKRDPPDKMTLNVPTAVKELRVPFEFKDLPLP